MCVWNDMYFVALAFKGIGVGREHCRLGGRHLETRQNVHSVYQSL